MSLASVSTYSARPPDPPELGERSISVGDYGNLPALSRPSWHPPPAAPVAGTAPLAAFRASRRGQAAATCPATTLEAWDIRVSLESNTGQSGSPRRADPAEIATTARGDPPWRRGGTAWTSRFK